MFRDETLWEACEQVRWHGTDAARKESVRPGMNGRLDSIQCAIVTEKLAIFGDELKRRSELAARYNQRLNGAVDPVDFAGKRESGWGYYTVAIDDRDAVQARMKDDGVPTAVYYSQPLHEMKAFARYAPEGGLPEAERLAGRVLSLPPHPYLSDAQADYVCDRFLAAVEQQEQLGRRRRVLQGSQGQHRIGCDQQPGSRRSRGRVAARDRAAPAPARRRRPRAKEIRNSNRVGAPIFMPWSFATPLRCPGRGPSPRRFSRVLRRLCKRAPVGRASGRAKAQNEDARTFAAVPQASSSG